MSTIPLISQGDGFLYDPLIAGVGAAYSSFTWPATPNVWVPVNFNSAIPGSGPPPFQYLTPDGGFCPTVAGWWNLFFAARPYAGFGTWEHWFGIFKNGRDPSNLVLQSGGQQVVQAAASETMYLNGTDTLYMSLMTTRPGPNNRSFTASQCNIQGFYLRP